ncbi:MAG TPA: response regulator transcription factor [Acidimicrobiia bacterium]|nr:response regulator transcription factor [Acidimicrobiia bacterium]
MRILIVEDEQDLAAAVRRGLSRRGHAVDIVGSVSGAEMALATSAHDLVILDWNLPDGAGVDLAARIKSGEVSTLEGATPRILMLTARDTLDDRVLGLDSGADDYLVKPFAFAELEARVRALLRRDTTASPVLELAGIILDPARFVATRDGRDLGLTAKEFALLEYFLAHPDVVLSQEHLLEHVWDEMADPFTNTVRVTISNLRKKLGDPPVIETIPGRGYVVRA